MSTSFNKKTFQYFDAAAKNKNNIAWFEKNKSLYMENVKEPFSAFLLQIKKDLSQDLPLIHIDSSSISRPLRPKNRAREGGLVKNFTHVTLCEKKTSLFEWNPGIHFQVGSLKDDNFLGLGLYMVSSRQLSLLRHHLSEDFETIDQILINKKFRNSWGTLKGDKYKRFPKGYDPDDENNKYLWYKQFYVGYSISRKDLISPLFFKKAVQDLKVAMPFLNWIRQSVGTYRLR